MIFFSPLFIFIDKYNECIAKKIRKIYVQNHILIQISINFLNFLYYFYVKSIYIIN